MGDEGFIKQGSFITFAHPFPLSVQGVSVDAIPLPIDGRDAARLSSALDHCVVDTSLGVPVPILAPRWLAFMKMLVGRHKDYSDVSSMLDAGTLSETELLSTADGDPELLEEIKAFLANRSADG